MPRSFLFGLFRIPMWDYYWGLSAAQVELLSADQPIVVYKSDKESTPWKDGKATSSYANEQYRNWLDKKRLREKEGKSYDYGRLLTTGELKKLE